MHYRYNDSGNDTLGALERGRFGNLGALCDNGDWWFGCRYSYYVGLDAYSLQCV